MRVVVTGAAGFIGSNLVHGLNAIGIDDVLAVDDMTDGAKYRNLLGAQLSDYFDKGEFYARFSRGELGHVDAVLFSDYGKGGLTHLPRMIESARRAGKPVLVDPKGRDWSRYAGATVVTPNRAELAQVVGDWGDEAALEARAEAARAEYGLQGLLLTRAEEGMSLFDAAGHVRVEAEAREVFDVTGAGDTVIATLAALLACGLTLREAMPIANRAGGIVVGKFGTASVSYEELFE